jgi:DNA-binding response OmpR family regulator
LSPLHSQSLKPPFYRDEHLFVSLSDQLVILDCNILTLTRTEYRVLAVLVTHAGAVVPRPILLMLTPMVDMHLSRLRKKLGIYFDRHIETVIGVGYRFRPAFPPRDQASTIALPAGAGP